MSCFSGAWVLVGSAKEVKDYSMFSSMHMYATVLCAYVQLPTACILQFIVCYNPSTDNERNQMSPSNASSSIRSMTHTDLKKCSLLSVSSLLFLSGMISWMIWWVGDVLCLIFWDKVKREKGIGRAEMAAVDNCLRTKCIKTLEILNL